MKDKVFFDTNIFVYLWDRNSPAKAEICDRLIAEALTDRRGVISFQVAQEFFNVAFKKFKPPPTSEEAEHIADSFFARLGCVPSSMALVLEAVRLRERHQLAWWDSLIVAAAIEAGCGVLYSEDFQDGQVFEGTLTVVDPFALHKN